jgi:hypothetical protein
MNWAFVTGPDRSGTTAMQERLSRHPQCRILNETGFPGHFLQAFRPPNGDFGGYAEIRWGHSHLRTDRVETWQLPRLTQQMGMTDVELARVMCQALRAQHGPVEVFGDKSPWYAWHWPQVLEVLPEAQFIIMERPAHECAASMQRNGWISFVEAFERAKLMQGMLADCPGLRVAQPALRDHEAAVLAQAFEYLGLDPGEYPVSDEG